MIRMIQFAATVALTLTLAACGGDDGSALRDQIAMLEMERDEATTAKMTAEDQVADLQAEAEQLKSEIAMLMGRADISPEGLAALRTQVETLMGRADISPEDLTALREELEEFRMAQMLEGQREQERRDAQTLAGLAGGLARSPQPPVYAASDQDTVANLLPGGDTVYSPISSGLRRDFLGTDRGVTQSQLGAAYVKSVSSDGEGGFHVTYVIEGEESPIHFAANQYNPQFFQFEERSENTESYFWSWTDSFSGEADDDQTDGSTFFDYFDFHGWMFETGDGLYQGSLSYGARTMPDNLPMGNATYEGYMLAERWSADNPDWPSWSERFLEGDLTLEANLDDMEISGLIDGIRIPWWASDSGENEPLDVSNSIGIASTAIDQAQFSASWVGNGPMDAAPDGTFHGFTGTILGEFYGPAAEEIGGVISGSRAAMGDTPEQLIAGGFGAAQPDSEQ